VNDVDHKDYEKKLVLRPMQAADVEQVLELNRRCFPKMVPWTTEQIRSQLERFPEGQVVVDVDGQVVASSSSLIIELDEYAGAHTWTQIADDGYIRNHDPGGDTLYGIEIMVHPEFRGMRIARRLYDERKRLCREKNLKRILIGGRLPGYAQHREAMTAREYVEEVVARRLHDPVLTAQLANGFTLKRLLRGYLHEDEASDGYATMLEWVNLDYHPDPNKQYLASRPVRICVVQYQLREVKSFHEFAQQCEYFVDVAAGYNSDFVLFPELLTTQMLSFIPAKRPALAVRELAQMTPDYLDLFSRLAVSYNVNVIGGTHVVLEDDDLYNVAFLFKRNGEIGKQYKLHVTPNEALWWGTKPGDALEVFDTDKGPISIQVCYDVEFPELARVAVERGARLLFVPFCTEDRQGYLRVRSCAQARCIENQVFVALAGTVGNLPFVENMDVQYAQSAILTPSDYAFARDAIAAECTPNVETIVVHDVDLQLLERYRRSGTVLNWNDRRTDLYEVHWKGHS
jgi:predicted amidohydrolase/ribosomal protein S18 acetylase RimI-like enzyme